MNSYKDLEIYRIAFALAVRVHIESLKLPKFELYVNKVARYEDLRKV